MAAEANIPLDDELNTTAPQDKPSVWKMPEPIFRRTSGRLPQGFEKQFAAGTSGEQEPPVRPVSVEPYAEPKPKSSTVKAVVVALALIAMVAFLIAFVSIVYYFFLRSPE